MRNKEQLRFTRLCTIVKNLNDSVTLAKKVKNTNGVVDKFLSDIEVYIKGFTEERDKMRKKHKQKIVCEYC